MHPLAIGHMPFAIGSLLLFQSLFRQFDRLHHGAGFVACFFVLMFWIRVGDNARAGLDEGPAARHNDRADIDAHVHITRKPDVADGAGVGPASGRLKFFDDFHRSDFWGTGHGPGRKARLQHIIDRLVRAQLACDIRDHMHDVRVPLDIHQRFARGRIPVQPHGRHHCVRDPPA